MRSQRLAFFALAIALAAAIIGGWPAKAPSAPDRPQIRRLPAPKPKPFRTARASTYGGKHEVQSTRFGMTDDLEAHGVHYVAHKTLPIGTLVIFRYHGRTVEAVVCDRGPFVGGREFDLGETTRAHLRFSGVGRIEYRVTRRLKRSEYKKWSAK
jgi:rare lipoprotein A (peptidoglycan hydrolase)